MLYKICPKSAYLLLFVLLPSEVSLSNGRVFISGRIPRSWPSQTRFDQRKVHPYFAIWKQLSGLDTPQSHNTEQQSLAVRSSQTLDSIEDNDKLCLSCQRVALAFYFTGVTFYIKHSQPTPTTFKFFFALQVSLNLTDSTSFILNSQKQMSPFKRIKHLQYNAGDVCLFIFPSLSP